MTLQRLDGKVCLITGAAGGIGAATARMMAKAGTRVVVTDLLMAQASEVAESIISTGGEALAVNLNVADPESWATALHQTIDQFSGLDVLVNNAGVLLCKDIQDVSVSEWQKMVDVNLTGVFLGTKHCAPALREAGKRSAKGSAIVNMSSVAGLVAAPLDALYSMTKGGVTLFTKSTAVSFATRGDRIRVNAVHPGVINTEMGLGSVDHFAELRGASQADSLRATAARHPLNRIGEPSEIAEGVIYLASDAAAFITGSSLVIDGGLTAQ